MDIRKFAGGSSMPVFVHYSPVIQSNAETSQSASLLEADTSSKKSGGESELSTKDLIKSLDQLEGLPNEINAIDQDIQKFIYNQSNSIDPTTISMEYASLVGKIKIAKFNAEQYKNAFNQIKSNGGINEIAIDQDGYIYCRNRQDPNDFERFTSEEYLANYQDYKAMTNYELLDLRSKAPGLINNNEILGVVANGMGMQAIQGLINSAITQIGTTTMQQAGYSQEQAQQISDGVDAIKSTEDNDDFESTKEDSEQQSAGILKLKTLSKTQQEQAKMALAYIYSVLPKNARALLDIKAAESGIKGGAQGLITTLISSKLSLTQTMDQDLRKDPTKSSSKSKQKTSAVPKGVDPLFAKLTLSPVMMAQLGLSEREQITTVQGTKYSATNYAQVVPIVDKEGKSMGATITLNDVSKSQLAGALKITDATMGGARIDPMSVGKVAITGANMYIINVPIDKSRSDGVIAPDLKYLKKLEQADDEVEQWKKQHSGNEITIQQINEIYKKHGLPVLMDDNGKLNVKDYCKFAVFNGMTKNTCLEATPDGSDVIAQDITGNSNAIQNYKDILSGGKKEDNQEDFKEDAWYNIGDIFFDHEVLYKACVFIPLRTDILSGAMTSGQNLTVAEAEGIYAKNRQKDRIQGYVDGSSKFE